MYLTEKEIFTQQASLEQTFDAIEQQLKQLSDYFSPPVDRFAFFGCGSSHMVAKSARAAFALSSGVSSCAIAGGDYMLDPSGYRAMLGEGVALFLSRSGATSEMLLAAEAVRETSDARIVSITMRSHSPLAERSDYTLELPWAFDESVCQTRTVTNLYTAVLLFWAMYEDNSKLKADLLEAIRDTAQRLSDWRQKLENVAKRKFADVVVLADGVLGGIAEEAALAFTEICMISGKAFSLLDYRHGPKVLGSESTLYLMAMRPGNTKLQSDMLADIRATGGCVVLICPEEDKSAYQADIVLTVPYKHFSTYGIPLVQAAQVIALEKALATGVNPDAPTGLDAFIKL